jgi:glycerol uptake facilitator-like aquaporin
MSHVSIRRRLAAEFVGTLLLLATVVGSGIMAEQLAGGNIAIALLGNTIPTGAILFVLIVLFGPVSGAHFNPAVSLSFAFRQDISAAEFFVYIAAQITGALIGVLIAHAMFDVEVIQLSAHERAGAGQGLSELVATFGLVLVILGCKNRGTILVAAAVGLYITAAYWFTASTGFANPAVTIGRVFTDSFSGIEPGSAVAFVLAQLAGACLATLFASWLFAESADVE